MEFVVCAVNKLLMVRVELNDSLAIPVVNRDSLNLVTLSPGVMILLLLPMVRLLLVIRVIPCGGVERIPTGALHLSLSDMMLLWVHNVHPREVIWVPCILGSFFVTVELVSVLPVAEESAIVFVSLWGGLKQVFMVSPSKQVLQVDLVILVLVLEVIIIIEVCMAVVPVLPWGFLAVEVLV